VVKNPLDDQLLGYAPAAIFKNNRETHALQIEQPLTTLAKLHNVPAAVD
jgi:hypothetical protein